MHGIPDAGLVFYSDVKERLAQARAQHDRLLVLPAVTFILSEAEQEAQDYAAHVRRQQ